MAQDNSPLFCDRCSAELLAGAGNLYLVRIEAVADPFPSKLKAEDAEDTTAEIKKLFRRLDAVTEQEAMDQVFRRVVLYFCTSCYNGWIENPVGR